MYIYVCEGNWEIKEVGKFIALNGTFSFTGLAKHEAAQYLSYYHVRRPENPWDRNIVVRADYNLSLDFLDSIACDLPIGKIMIIARAP